MTADERPEGGSTTSRLHWAKGLLGKAREQLDERVVERIKDELNERGGERDAGKAANDQQRQAATTAQEAAAQARREEVKRAVETVLGDSARPGGELVTGRYFEDEFIRRIADREVADAVPAKEAELAGTAFGFNLQESAVKGQFYVTRPDGQRLTAGRGTGLMSRDAALEAVAQREADARQAVLDAVEKSVRARDELSRGIVERAGLHRVEAGDVKAIERAIRSDAQIRVLTAEAEAIQEDLAEIAEYVGNAMVSAKDFKLRSRTGVLRKVDQAAELSGVGAGLESISASAHPIVWVFVTNHGLRTGAGLIFRPTMVHPVVASAALTLFLARKGAEQAAVNKAKEEGKVGGLLERRAANKAVEKRAHETAATKTALEEGLRTVLQAMQTKANEIASDFRVANYRPSDDALKAFQRRAEKEGCDLTSPEARQALTDAYATRVSPARPT